MARIGENYGEWGALEIVDYVLMYDVNGES